MRKASSKELRVVQKLLAGIFLFLAVVYVCVAFELFDVSLLAYSKCRTCRRIEIPTVWTIWLMALMFALISLGIFLHSLERSGRFADFINSIAWLLFCGLLARYAIGSGDDVASRVFVGALAMIFLVVYVWYCWILKRANRTRLGLTHK